MNKYEFNKEEYDNFYNGIVTTKPKNRQQTSDEVYTPSEIINKILDRVNPEDWSNPDITIAEPAAGNGRFVIKFIFNFMNGLKNIIPDENKRFKHIIENCIYSYEINMDRVLEMVDNIERIFGKKCLYGVKSKFSCYDFISAPIGDYNYHKVYNYDFFYVKYNTKKIDSKLRRNYKLITKNIRNYSVSKDFKKMNKLIISVRKCMDNIKKIHDEGFSIIPSDINNYDIIKIDHNRFIDNYYDSFSCDGYDNDYISVVLTCLDTFGYMYCDDKHKNIFFIEDKVYYTLVEK